MSRFFYRALLSMLSLLLLLLLSSFNSKYSRFSYGNMEIKKTTTKKFTCSGNICYFMCTQTRNMYSTCSDRSNNDGNVDALSTTSYRIWFGSVWFRCRNKQAFYTRIDSSSNSSSSQNNDGDGTGICLFAHTRTQVSYVDSIGLIRSLSSHQMCSE